jgi:glycosyltransferase involved in cell wall biosynthesis
MTILLSICIPTLNRAAFIGETLDSIIPQLNDETEVVIVDGGSCDGTDAVVASRASRCSHIRYQLSQHLVEGDAKPSNAGYDRDCDHCIATARGRYCWILPDDDLLVPDAITTILQYLNADLALIVANAQIRDRNVKQVLATKILLLENDERFVRGTADRLFARVGLYLTYAGGVIVRRDFWMKRSRETYYGTGFVHMAVLFQDPSDLDALVIARPLMLIRYGNAHWTDRTFQLWMFDFPRLVWSFPLGDSAKRAVTLREPWKRLKTLLLYRGKGLYSQKEYRRLRNEAGLVGFARMWPWLVAHMPAPVVNQVLLTWFRWRRGVSSTVYQDFHNAPVNPFRDRLV